MSRLWLAIVLLTACGTEPADSPEHAATASHDTAAAAGADIITMLSERDRARVAAAERIIDFLRGGPELDASDVADTVAFHLPRGAGGGGTVMSRAELRVRENWQVRGAHGLTWSLVPPSWTDVLTTRVGRHLRCFEYDLAEEFPDLAGQPHVGTMLRPADAQSCLQSWNLTLIFDDSPRPVLIAAVYDQWEW
jgi:hypothetical protein